MPAIEPADELHSMNRASPVVLILKGLKALVAALVATLAVYGVSAVALSIPPEFPPLAGPGPTIFFTAVGALGAWVVYAALAVVTERPRAIFRWVAGVVLLLSFVPDLWLLSEGAAGSFPGATPAGVTVLMVMHVAAAGAIVWALTGEGEPEESAGR